MNKTNNSNKQKKETNFGTIQAELRKTHFNLGNDCKINFL